MGTVKQFNQNHPQLDFDANILKNNSKNQEEMSTKERFVEYLKTKGLGKPLLKNQLVYLVELLPKKRVLVQIQ